MSHRPRVGAKAFARLTVLAVLTVVVGTAAFAQRTASVTGNWSSTATWGGLSVPTSTDAVTINSGVVVTVDNGAPTAQALSITINAAAAINGITISGTNTLTVTNAVTMNAPSAGAVTSTLSVGTGVLTAGSISIAGSATAGRFATLSVSTGTITSTGAITFSGTAAQARLTFSGAGTLNVGGNLGNGGTFTASTGTVNYNGAAQTIGNYTYNNLTLSGSGVKTEATATVNGILSMEGTATISAAPTYGAAATLRYNTATSRTVSTNEWISPFVATGGVIIANTGTITMNAAKVFNANVPLTIETGAFLATNNLALTFNGNLVRNGTLTAGSSVITITGTGTQSIDGFSTTGAITVSKAGGTATLNGALNAASMSFTTAVNATVQLASGASVNLTAGLSIARPGVGATSTFDVATGSLTCASVTLSATTAARPCTLSVSTGSITVSGNITAAGVGSRLVFSGAGTLTAGGTFMSGTAGTFTASTGTVIFNAAGAQSIAPFAYTFNRVTLAGSGAKTTTSATINDTLSLEGTATTAGTIATYGAAATLQYRGTGAQTTGIEFPATWSGTGGVIIANTSGNNVTLGAAKVVNASLIINNGATLATNNFDLTFGGNFDNGGTFTAGSSNIDISNTATQSIDGFTTTGTVSMTKASGTATFTGAVNGGAFTLNGAGTLDLGTGFTHTFTGTWTRTNGVLAGNSSTLNLGGTTTNTAGTFTPGTSTVNYNGGAQVTANVNYHNLVLSVSGAKTLGTGTTAISGDLTLSGSASTTTAAALAVSGNLTLTDASTAQLTAGAAMNVTGNVNVGSGTTLVAGNFTHTVGGNWTKSGTFTATGSTVDFNGAGTGAIGASNFNNVTFSGSGAKTAIGALTIAGNVSLTNNFSAGSFSHTVAGNWTNSGGTLTPGTSTVQFTGTTGTQTLNAQGETFHILQFTGAALKSITGASMGAARVDVLATTGTVTNDVTTFTMTNISGISFTVASGTMFIQGTGALTMTGGDFENDGTVENNGTITVN